jgi:pimeloyl-ACP methyl ester carboxylesterase
MAYVTTHDGHRLHVRILGRGQPCVLVHGFASEGRAFLPFVAPLLRRYRFILPDLRGFGRSAHVPLGSSDPLSVYARDLASIVDGLALERPALGGHSMGAFSCLAHFRDFGEARARAYLHIDQGFRVANGEEGAYGLMGPAQPAFFARLRALLDALVPLEGTPFARLPADLRAELFGVFGDFVEAAFGRPIVGRLARAIVAREVVAKRLINVHHYGTLLTIMRAYLERSYDMRAVFAQLGLPVHVLIGGASRMYPSEGQRHHVRTLLPGARTTVLPGVGHMVLSEAPRTFVRSVDRYLAEAYA